MARQTTYAPDAIVQNGDKWLIVDSADGVTKSLSVEALADYFAKTGIADPNRVGFHYTYTANEVLSPGQFTYVGNPTGYGSVTQIKLHRRTSRGQDFTPVLALLNQTDIKITDINDPNAFSYGYFQVLAQADQSGDEITIPLSFISGNGGLPNEEVVFTILGHFGDVSGGNIFDGTEDPITAMQAGGPQDIYLHIRRDVDELDVYGPPGVNVPDENGSYAAWGDPLRLKGPDGQAVTNVISTPTTGGINLQFYVGDPQTEVGNLIFVPEGPQGPQGIGITDTENLTPPVAGTNTTVTVTLTNPADSSTTTTTFEVAPGNDGTNADPLVIGAPTTDADSFNIPYSVGSESGTWEIPLPMDGTAGDTVEFSTPNTPALGQPTEFTITVTHADGTTTVTPVTIAAGQTGSQGEGLVVGSTADLSNGDVEVFLVGAQSGDPAGSFISRKGDIGPDGQFRVQGHDVNQILFAGDAVVSNPSPDGDITVTITDAHGGTIPATTGEDDGDVLTIQDASTGTLQWSAPYSLDVSEDDSTIESSVDRINFTGSGVDVTTDPDTGVVNVNITGGSGPTPSLQPRIAASGSTTYEIGGTSPTTTALTVTAQNVTTPLSGMTLTASFGGSNFTISAPTYNLTAGTATYTVTFPTDSVQSDTLTIEGTYTEVGDPTVHSFTNQINRTYRTFEGFWFGQDNDHMDFPGAGITLQEFFDGNPVTGSDQGEFSSPESITALLADGQWAWFAFPGDNSATADQYRFQNQMKDVIFGADEVMYDASIGYTFYRIQLVAARANITITR